MARIVIDLSDKDMESMTAWAQANGFETAAGWVDELFRIYMAREFLAAEWRLEQGREPDWFDELVTDPGGGVWHEDDYPGE